MKFEKYLNEGQVEWFNYGAAPADRWEILKNVKDVPSLLRAVGQGAKKISLESEGDRKALNKAIKGRKPVFVTFNPFHQDVSSVNQILWFTNRKKLVRTANDLAAEV